MSDPEQVIPGSNVRVEEAARSVAEHLRAYLEGDADSAHLWDSSVVGGPGPVPTLLLIAKGAKSGATRYSPLIYGRVDAGWVIVASKGGQPVNPSWYHNLVAHPEVEIKVASDTIPVRARVTTGEERTRLWAVMTEVFPNYDSYQATTEREIPVVLLEPR